MYRIFDLLDGSRVTPEYADTALSQGVKAIHVTVNNFSVIRPYPTLQEALSELAAIRAHYAKLSEKVMLIERFADFAKAEKENKLGIVLGYQNVPGVGTDLKMLELFHALGVRVIQVAHNNRGVYADGCAETGNAGLSNLGRELIAELNRLRIVIDISHTGERSSIETIEASSAPVCATHANAFAVYPNVRNKQDTVLDALKRKEGVIGICYLMPMVAKGTEQTHGDMAKHAVHVRDRIGARHIGIGSDFILGQPPERYQEFLRRPEVYGTWPWRYPVLDLADQQVFLGSLKQHGFSESEIQGVAGDNFMRVFQQVLQ
ncbi:dipeptidase [Microbacteriaceae bacterium K1510]|nr:dipeptidase [Microbacteriaceae bacterium K1510]